MATSWDEGAGSETSGQREWNVSWTPSIRGSHLHWRRSQHGCITHLIAEEDGPADLVLILRSKIGTNVLGTLMDCFQCLSLWIAIPFAFAVTRSLPEWGLVWLALSGAACLLERFRSAPAELRAYPLSSPENHDPVELRPCQGHQGPTAPLKGEKNDEHK